MTRYMKFLVSLSNYKVCRAQVFSNIVNDVSLGSSTKERRYTLCDDIRNFEDVVLRVLSS